MAWVNIFDLLTNPTQLVVEYNDWTASTPWEDEAWALANEAPVLQVVGNKLVMTTPSGKDPAPGKTGWGAMRVRVNPPLPFPVPAGIRVLVRGRWWDDSGYPSSTVYVGDVFTGDVPAGGSEGFEISLFLPPNGVEQSDDLRGTIELADPLTSGIVSMQPWQAANWPQELELEIFVSANSAFWMNHRNTAEMVDATGQVAPAPEPGGAIVYQITQATNPDYGWQHGCQGGHRWAEPEFGSYTAPEGAPQLFMLRGSDPFEDEPDDWWWNGELWLNVGSPEQVVSAVLSDGTNSLDILTVGGYVSDYNVIYGEPGVMWGFSVPGAVNPFFDGVKPLTLTVTLAE